MAPSPTPPAPAEDDPITDADLRAIASTVEAWFAHAARDLPWRAPPGAPRDPYRVLVSEIMLQQTQVARVLERYDAFIERFPTARALADASEQDVLAAWSGLGYYRRARLLHAAARAVADDLDGAFPNTAERLLALPGVGRYTAGAVASLAFGAPAAAVDGNVTRLLQRVGARPGAADDRAIARWVWRLAERLVEIADSPAALNEGLIELGATVCTPAAPRCGACPLRSVCASRAHGVVDRIPSPKRPAKRQTLHATSLVVTDPAGRLLLERRGAAGLWAGLWQCLTDEGPSPIDPAIVAARVGLESSPEHVASFDHTLTHRLVRFDVWRAESDQGRGSWIEPNDLANLGVSNAQRRVLETALGVGAGLFSG